ncbi:MAG TPA: hypothetical protein ENI27_09805 [bacterium]|nr:hypothetical protein [bacterium]
MHTISDRILDAIGAEAMATLCQEFGGTALYIPHHVPQPQRDDNIITLFSDTLKAGASTMTAYDTCATTHHLSIRQIQTIVARG